jgi:hypothetical protein
LPSIVTAVSLALRYRALRFLLVSSSYFGYLFGVYSVDYGPLMSSSAASVHALAGASFAALRQERSLLDGNYCSSHPSSRYGMREPSMDESEGARRLRSLYAFTAKRRRLGR